MDRSLLSPAAPEAPPELVERASLLRSLLDAQRGFVTTAAVAHASYLDQAAAALLCAAATPSAGPAQHAPRPDAAPPRWLSPPAPPRPRERVRFGRFAVRLRPAPPSGFAVPGLLRPGSNVAVTPDGRGVAEALCDLLARRGIRPKLQRRPPLDADVVLHLAGLREAPTLESAFEINFEAFRIARALAGPLSHRGGALVLVQDTGGDFGRRGSVRAGAAGLAGLAKTAAWEWPRAHLRAIDLALEGRPPAEAAARLLEELIAGGTEIEVGLPADGRRLVPVTEQLASPSGASALDAEDRIIVTGGARGVTAASVIELARRTRARFVLLGRTVLTAEPEACRGLVERGSLMRRLYEDARARGEPLSPRQLDERVRSLLAAREVRETLAAIEAAGGTARYLEVDVLDAAQLGPALSRLRAEWGAFTALVHGAGVNADRRIVEKEEAEARLVFDTKVRGLANVLLATADDPLRAICCFSSVSGRFGNPGQADYAMANEVATRLLAWERRRRPDLRVSRSIGWGPWDGGMVTPALKARWEAAGVPVLSLSTGTASFCAELTDGVEDDEVVVGSEFGVIADGPVATTSAELAVSRRAHPEIASHVIGGSPVVPVAIVHEWLVRKVSTELLALPCVRCLDLSVLRGIKLEHYDGAGDLLRIGARVEVDAGQCLRSGFEQSFALTVHDAAGALRYRARARCTRTPLPSWPAPAHATLPALETPVYGPGGMFHGPMFQVASGVACGEGEASCSLAGALDVGWTGDQWRTDPAVIDGALQLAGLWSRSRRGGEWLPTGIGEIEVYSPGLLRGPLRGTLAARELDGDHSVSDVWVLTPDGAVVAELLRVSFHRYGA